MCGAPKARIIGSESHFHHIQQSFSDRRALLDQVLGCFLGGHLKRSVVISGTYDQIDFGGDSTLIRYIVMRQGATRCFNNPYSFSGFFSWDGAEVIAGNFRIGCQLYLAFCCVKQLD